MSTGISTGAAALLNRFLRSLGLQIVRTRTIERLCAERTGGLEEQPTGPAHLELAARVSALEATRADESIRNVISYAMKAHWRLAELIEALQPKSEDMRCALCGHHDSASSFKPIESDCLFFGGHLVRHQCPSCDVIFGPRKVLELDDQMLDLEYRNLYRMYAEGDNTESIMRTFMLLSPTREGQYLDFGCGGEWSAAIERLRADAWNILGFEPSARNSSAHVMSTWTEVEQCRFDGILSHNVLEHLFDPATTTARLGNVLKDGGRLVHATPCFDYAYDYSHFHVFFFTGRSPEVLARKANMRIADWVRDGDFIACIMEKGALPASCCPLPTASIRK